MSAMEPANVALIVIAWVLLDAMIVAGLVLMRLRGERRVRHAGQQLAAEAECYVNAVGAKRAAAVQAAALDGARERNLSAQRR
jgi:cytochrome c-type biogenesis protein CcmH/NrfF